MGAEYIVGIDTQPGDLMLLFPAGSQLSEQYADVNNCVRVKNEDGTTSGGMFEQNRRVKALKLRGVKSEGYLASVSSLEFTGGDWRSLLDGDIVADFNDVPVCKRYFKPSELRAGRQSNQVSVKHPLWDLFKQHVDTTQLRFAKFNVGDLLTLTVKSHGTSTRMFTYNHTDTQTIPQTFLQKLFKKPTKTITTTTRKTITGSRKVILDNDQTDGGWYGTNEFRFNTSNKYATGTHIGETIYGEIVGYVDNTSTLIMGKVSTKSAGKEFEKQWGKTMLYKYGMPEGKSDFYVYRITQTSDDGAVTELSWSQVKRRCLELGAKHVLEYSNFRNSAQHLWLPYDDKEQFIKAIYEFVENIPDPIDPSHIMEGVVIRVDRIDGTVDFYKAKSFSFLAMEHGTDVTDMEEEA